MTQKLQDLLEKLIRISFYAFVFLLPWQTKLILRSAGDNFNEISIYFSHLVLIFSLGVFFYYKYLKKDSWGKKTWLWYSILGLMGLMFLSIFFAPDILLAIYKYVIVVIGVALFYLLQEAFKRPAYGEAILDKLHIIFTFLVSIFIHSALGIYQFLSQGAFAFKYLGLASQNPQDLGVSVVETISGRWLRACGGFDHPNIFGGVLVIALILSAYLLAKKKLIRTKEETGESLFMFVFFFSSFLALLFTFSRASWIAMAVGFFALFAMFVIKQEKWALRRLTTLFLFSLVLFGVAFASYQDLFQTRVSATSRLESISINERIDQFGEFKDVISSRWYSGTGIANYTGFLKKMDIKNGLIPKESWEYQPVHNSFLLLWAESGFIALLAFGAFIFFLWQRGKEDVFAWALLLPILILMFLDHWFFSLPFGIIFIFFLFGLI